MASSAGKSSRGGGGQPSPRAGQKPGQGPVPGNTRRTLSGRYVSISRDEQDQSIDQSITTDMSADYPMGYTVHIPPTPDNQPMSPRAGPTTSKGGQQFVSSTMFTGGYKAQTRGHVMEKVAGDHQDGRGNTCGVDGCDGKTMRNEHGEDIYPCNCNFKVCRDCYYDALNSGGRCPGCKDEYLSRDDPQGNNDDDICGPKMTPTVVVDDGGMSGPPLPAFNERHRRPLTRKLPIAPGVISPYRFLALLRLVILGFFLAWRIQNPNKEALWLWGMSVVCEIWFAFSWILDQLPKLCPVNRSTDLSVLKERFEKVSPENPRGKSDLPGMDVFRFHSRSRERTAPGHFEYNFFHSGSENILSRSFPATSLTMEVRSSRSKRLQRPPVLRESGFLSAGSTAIEPRNPDTYFMMRGDPTKGKTRLDFVKDRRRVKREYDEFKVRINGLGEAIRRRSDAYNAHEEIRAKRVQLESGADPSQPLNVNKATWMADGTHWPGTWAASAKEHSRGDHAGIIQVMLAPPG
ncbi:hypothetical protein R1sor_021188 [Riccia sorocarpa]|uniref:Cellulose synthase-like protein D3 n=1 Tax=Riccia sorocarpa TaxID=122646 RepID=A0ABD3GJ88_9MARC